MLWDIIYEFFIKYIFGGIFNGVDYSTSIGDVLNTNGYTYANGSLSSIRGFTYVSMLGYEHIMTLGNYFSFISTLISMVVIVLICCALIKKIYNMCAHIIG